MNSQRGGQLSRQALGWALGWASSRDRPHLSRQPEGPITWLWTPEPPNLPAQGSSSMSWLPSGCMSAKSISVLCPTAISSTADPGHCCKLLLISQEGKLQATAGTGVRHWARGSGVQPQERGTAGFPQRLRKEQQGLRRPHLHRAAAEETSVEMVLDTWFPGGDGCCLPRCTSRSLPPDWTPLSSSSEPPPHPRTCPGQGRGHPKGLPPEPLING